MNLFFNLNNRKGMMLIWFYLLIGVLVITGGSLYSLAFQESRLIAMDQARDKAFYVAEGGLDRKLAEIRSGSMSAVYGSLGIGSYAASYDSTTKKITAQGTVNGITKTIIAVVSKTIPPGAKAAITSEGDMSFNGNITVDGRDHDASGNLTGDPGTYGASSGGTVTQSGSSDIGGNGIAPSSPANPATIQQGSSNPFNSPEELLGVPSGSLDQYKTATPPSTPFNGIVYYTGDSWIAPDLGTESNPSTGILIVHNATGDALLKNIHGYFKGIIIADDIVHINGNATIIGGVIAKTSTGTTGDGSAEVLYSSSVLEDLPAGNYTTVSWEDTQNPSYTYL
ncbi:MAG: hypothetical protein HYS55_01465 [Candidatus Omnitrophica bacterium]|nr:hypothetical protein [Candidatus Omnitrophota bacterium]